MAEEKMETKLEEKKETKKIAEAPEKKSDEKKPEAKKDMKKPKTEAVVNSLNAHLSAKTSAAVCKFIVGKTINRAMDDLKDVLSMKRAIPMKGEIPHRKGKGMMAGRFPKNASKHFIKMLKTLEGNANVNGIESPVIVEAIANIGERPYGQFGRIRRKRAHIKIIAKNKIKKESRERKK
ncbi:MAG: hypothetical protein KGH55_01115 [Nanoarchaeota archaeon]|nr:hypothetical protein [Nanoarchaeota archaeon]